MNKCITEKDFVEALNNLDEAVREEDAHPIVWEKSADLGYVASTSVYMDGRAAVFEEIIKTEIDAGKFASALSEFDSVDEPVMNYLAACICAFRDLPEIRLAMRSGKFKGTIFLAVDSGDWEFGEHYYDEEYRWIQLAECRFGLESDGLGRLHRAMFVSANVGQAPLTEEVVDNNPF